MRVLQAMAMLATTGLAATAPVCAQDSLPSPQIASRTLQGLAPVAGEQITLELYATMGGGDLRLYETKRSADLGLVYPYCVSADAAEWDNEDQIAFNRQWVRVSGTYVAWPGSTRNFRPVQVNGVYFGNSCAGPLVLEVQSAEIADQSSYAAQDCVSNLSTWCIPPEWDQYWTFNGILIRSPAPALDGPVTIRPEASDVIFNQPLDGLTRSTLGNAYLFTRLACEGEAACTLEIARTAKYGLAAAERDGLPRTGIGVEAESPEMLETALRRVRYCLEYDCPEGGASISLADLRDRGAAD